MKENYSTPLTESLKLAAESVVAASDGNPSGTLPGFTNGDFWL
jgi:hypothetical protein